MPRWLCGVFTVQITSLCKGLWSLSHDPRTITTCTVSRITRVSDLFCAAVHYGIVEPKPDVTFPKLGPKFGGQSLQTPTPGAHMCAHPTTHLAHMPPPPPPTHTHMRTNVHAQPCTHTHTFTHPHTLVLAHCHNWSRASSLGKGERYSKRNLGKMTQ